MKRALTITAVTFAAVIFAVSCGETTNATANTEPISQDSLIKKGEYLVTIMGCDDCHSPKVFGPQGPGPDPAKRLSGHPADMPIGPVDTAGFKSWMYFNHFITAAAGPWGVSFSANLTSDSTGIGSWTYEQFEIALRKGKSKGIESNRMLLPPMPWPNMAKLKDEDMRAIFAFLKSTKPVKNVVPAPIPPTEFNKKG